MSANTSETARQQLLELLYAELSNAQLTAYAAGRPALVASIAMTLAELKAEGIGSQNVKLNSSIDDRPPNPYTVRPGAPQNANDFSFTLAELIARGWFTTGKPETMNYPGSARRIPIIVIGDGPTRSRYGSPVLPPDILGRTVEPSTDRRLFDLPWEKLKESPDAETRAVQRMEELIDSLIANFSPWASVRRFMKKRLERQMKTEYPVHWHISWPGFDFCFVVKRTPTTTEWHLQVETLMSTFSWYKVWPK